MHDRSEASRPGSVLPLARPSTVDLIARELRAAIASGALPVGSAIGEAETAAQLGVSRGPLREGAQRLVQEGILRAVPGRGLRVTTIVGDEVDDVFRTRIAIESDAVRRIVADGRDLDDVQATFDAFERASGSEDAFAIGDADLSFHRALVHAAGSARLDRAMETLSLETRIASLSDPEGYAVRQSISPTYRVLLAALAEGDAGAAIAALVQQLEEAADRLRGRTEVETIERTPSARGLQPIDAADPSDGAPTSR